MLSTRYGHAAAAGSDGRIYAIGGLNRSSSVLQTVEAYDPDSGNWTYVAPMPTPRFGLAVVAGPDDRIYALGGTNSLSISDILNTVDAYTP